MLRNLQQTFIICKTKKSENENKLKLLFQKEKQLYQINEIDRRINLKMRSLFFKL